MAFPSKARAVGPAVATGVIGSLWIVLVGMIATPVQAQPEIAVIGGVGVPGGTVAMVLELRGASGSRGAAVMARVDFPAGAIEALPGECSIAPRLQATHALGEDTGAGFVAVDIAPRGGGEDPLLGDGALASCGLQIRLGVAAGTVALVISSARLVDDMGGEIAVRTTNGVVEILGPTATPTQTPPPSATSTPTPTLPPSATSTPTQTPSPTDSPGPTFTVRSASGPDGCSIAPRTEPRALDALCWLATPLSLWWARRRSISPR